MGLFLMVLEHTTLIGGTCYYFIGQTIILVPRNVTPCHINLYMYQIANTSTFMIISFISHFGSQICF
jgi:hypothetical protein